MSGDGGNRQGDYAITLSPPSSFTNLMNPLKWRMEFWRDSVFAIEPKRRFGENLWIVGLQVENEMLSSSTGNVITWPEHVPSIFYLWAVREKRCEWKRSGDCWERHFKAEIFSLTVPTHFNWQFVCKTTTVKSLPLMPNNQITFCQ